MAKPCCVLVKDFPTPDSSPLDHASARAYCRQLEAGNILLFRQPPFPLPETDRQFLMQHQASESAIHKNVSYRPEEDSLRGFGDAAGRERVHDIMRRYSRAVVEFAARFLTPYGGRWKLDYASFRPLEEAGRALPLHKRNDLLHVDAFPSRPTRGGRILRIFTNVHPTKPRVWTTADTFPDLAPRLAESAGLARYYSGWRPLGTKLAHLVGAPDRSPYDSFMLHFHDWLKENTAFQNGEKFRMEFAPMATWLVFTDGCPHAVLSGQYALEQTLIIPLNALAAPELAPIRVLEALCAGKLAA